MSELVLILILALVTLFALGRAGGTRGTSPADLLRTVGAGASSVARVGASYRPVEHLRH